MSQATYYNGYDDGVADTLRKVKKDGGGGTSGSSRASNLFRFSQVADDESGYESRPPDPSYYRGDLPQVLSASSSVLNGAVYITVAPPDGGWVDGDCIFAVVAANPYKLTGAFFNGVDVKTEGSEGMTVLLHYNGQDDSWRKRYAVY